MDGETPAPFGTRIGPQALLELRRDGVGRPYEARELLFMEHDSAGSVFLIESGRIKVYVTASDGTDLILGIYGQGELLCELSALERLPRSASGAGRKEGIVTEIPGPAFRAFVGRHPEAMLHILATVRHRLRRADQERLSYRSDRVRIRVIRKLLTWSESYGRRTPDGIVLAGFSRSDLAQSIAASEKTVDAVLADLTVKGVLATKREWFLLRDTAMLRAWTLP